MRVLEKTIRVELLAPIELNAEERELFRRALAIRRNAQIHLSKYGVGAAVLSESGLIYTGCNAERITYTQTTHAEQHAVDDMIKNEGPVKVVAMTVVGAFKGADLWNIERFARRPPQPEVEIRDLCFACAHCLQIAWENCMADQGVKLLMLTKWGEIGRTTIGDALPMPFGPENLGINIRAK